MLRESAWAQGGSESKPRDKKALTPKQAMDICAPGDFLPSVTIAKIGRFLKKP